MQPDLAAAVMFGPRDGPAEGDDAGAEQPGDADDLARAHAQRHPRQAAPCRVGGQVVDGENRAMPLRDAAERAAAASWTGRGRRLRPGSTRHRYDGSAGGPAAAVRTAPTIAVTRSSLPISPVGAVSTSSPSRSTATSWQISKTSSR